MAKMLLTIAGVLILAFIVVAMYCAMVVAGRADENERKGGNNECDDDETVWKMKICPRCQTGKYTYELDPKSEICPYIGCWNKNKCHFYKPLDMPREKRIFSGFKTKRSDPHLRR